MGETTVKKRSSQNFTKQGEVSAQTAFRGQTESERIWKEIMKTIINILTPRCLWGIHVEMCSRLYALGVWSSAKSSGLKTDPI